MARHERDCFAERANIDCADITMHFMADETPSRSLLRGCDAVLFGGSGAYSVLDDIDWIHRTLDTLLEVIDLEQVAYASCFGFQGLALALGGTVTHDEARTEMGTTSLELTAAGRSCPLFSVLPDHFRAQQGHHDHVTTLPEGVELLARNNNVEAQAFRVTGVPFWASQFHPELNLDRTIDRFRHYQRHYVGDPSKISGLLKTLQAGGPCTPAVGSLLSRLVRHAF